MLDSLLRNVWYAAAWSSEVQDRPFSRTLLGQSVLLLRLTDGSVAALGNRCPHRFAPLDRGKLINDTIECGYHGLRFDRSGACVHAPGCESPPRQARVPTYAVVEKHRLIWLWGGDPAQADASRIPDLSALDDDLGRANCRDNYLHSRAHYLLTLDNLMDLSHVEFLHAGTLGVDGMSTGKLIVKETPSGIAANRWMPGIQSPPSFGPKMGFTGLADHWLDMNWIAPSTLILRVGLTTPGGLRQQGHEALSFHLITPETEQSCHYFWANSRDFALDQPGLIEAERAAINHAFVDQDKPMIEACAQIMNGAEFWSLKPVLLPADAGAVRMRRVLERMLTAEQAAASAAANS